MHQSHVMQCLQTGRNLADHLCACFAIERPIHQSRGQSWFIGPRSGHEQMLKRCARNTPIVEIRGLRFAMLLGP